MQFSFVKKLLESNSSLKVWEAEFPAAGNSCYSTSAIVRGIIGLMAAGNCNYADIERFHSDFLFRQVVGGKVPSQESLRQRLDALAKKDWQRILDANVSDQLSWINLTRIDVDGDKLILLDIDVSVFENTASRTECEFPVDKKSRQLRFHLHTVLLGYIKVDCKIVRYANQTIQKLP